MGIERLCLKTCIEKEKLYHPSVAILRLRLRSTLPFHPTYEPLIQFCSGKLSCSQPFTTIFRFLYHFCFQFTNTMKKTIICLVLAVIVFAACRKNQINPTMPTGQPSVIGNWNVETITTYMYDASGLRDSTIYTYPAMSGNDHYSFRFNTDDSWVESFSSSSQDPLHIAANGTYTITSDSSFTLLYPAATITRMSEPCKIVSLTNDLFIFSKQLATVFNGTDPGYIKYVFRLTK
jgi:hypothetical protein